MANTKPLKIDSGKLKQFALGDTIAADIVAVDNTSFIILTATNGQDLFEQIDQLFNDYTQSFLLGGM